MAKVYQINIKKSRVKKLIRYVGITLTCFTLLSPSIVDIKSIAVYVNFEYVY